MMASLPTPSNAVAALTAVAIVAAIFVAPPTALEAAPMAGITFNAAPPIAGIILLAPKAAPPIAGRILLAPKAAEASPTTIFYFLLSHCVQLITHD